MIEYERKVYPEIDKQEFDESIQPLLRSMEELHIEKKDKEESFYSESLEFNNEQYPYHNSCFLLSKEIWERYWDDSLNEYLSDYDKFENETLESLAGLIFSYFIRCFAEQIKNKDKGYKDYKDYNLRLLGTGFEELSNDYPVVWSRCMGLIENKIGFLVDTLGTVSRNRKEIADTFGIDPDVKIVSLESGGDTHNKGKSVSVIYFENGKKIVFKPRSVKGEKGYVKLAEELNEKFGTGLYAYKVLDLENNGFISFVERDESFQDMYKAGEMACLMYLLNATDMHYSNILWTKGGPVPIDLETLFRIPRVKKGLAESDKSAYSFMESSVYSTGVLPIQLGKSKNAVDVGFTGNRGEFSESPIKQIIVNDGFSKCINIKWSSNKSHKMIQYNKTDEKEIIEKCDYIVKGFTMMYKRILRDKEAFAEIVKRNYKGASLRYIHNMTYRYEQILRSLTSPQAAKDINITKMLLSRTGILSLKSETSIVESEIKQLFRGDVPYFSIDFSSRDIKADGKVVTSCKRSPEEIFAEKVERISEEDMEQQIKIIKFSFIAKLSDPDVKERKNPEDVIRYLADKLCDEVRDDHFQHLPITWVGPVLNHMENTWMPGVLGYDLYSGRIGPSVALLLAGKLLGEQRYTDVGYKMFDSSINILKDEKYEIRNLLAAGVGFYSGFTSIVWGINEAGKILGKDDWCQVAVDSFKIIDDKLLEIDDNFFDMICGKSAAIIFRHKIDKNYRLTRDQLEKIIEAGEKKLRNRDEMMTIGLAHGVCQIIWFFSVLEQIYHSAKITRLIKEADEVIRESYTSDIGNFIVYENENDHDVSSSWCNGLSGILLAYYEGYKVGIYKREDVEDIIEKLISSYIPDIPILCHGTLGIEEILEYISRDFKEETEFMLKHLNLGMCNADNIYNYFKHENGRYSLSPGYMTGQSGAICYLSKKKGLGLSVFPLTMGE
ncbi:type 2 lanthipeptide synthetase LanM [Eubacterium ruminantium]|uniref:type 2 lanthipeptide synthetase LanM n=1 Tax=Eubacterium ruminantium TaxID=42322 RepID=UPI0015695A53|nr:type 2 lanthipeptide synthetase LanM [Eubacterium ruminantium]